MCHHYEIANTTHELEREESTQEDVAPVADDEPDPDREPVAPADD